MRSFLACNILWQKELSEHHGSNSSCEYYCEVGSADCSFIRAGLHLLVRIAEEPTYKFLRTRERLGYRVDCRVKTFGKVTGFAISIQSTLPPDYLEERVEGFLNHFSGILETMDDKVFQRIRDTLITVVNAQSTSLYETGQKLWSSITNGSYNFTESEFAYLAPDSSAWCMLIWASRFRRSPYTWTNHP